MPTTGVSRRPQTFHPHTKQQFRPTTSPMMQVSSTPAMFRDDREHKTHNKESPSPVADVVSSETAEQTNNKDLNITPDMASKILKLIEAKSQSYEKAHKAAANAITVPAASTTKLKHLLEEKLPEVTSSLLTKDEENIELPSKHDHQAKATSIATKHHPSIGSEDESIEYPTPRLPKSASSFKQNPHQVDIVEPLVKKLPTVPQPPLNQQRVGASKISTAPQAPLTAVNGAMMAVDQPMRAMQPTHGLTQGVGQKAPIPSSSQVIK